MIFVYKLGFWLPKNNKQSIILHVKFKKKTEYACLK